MDCPRCGQTGVEDAPACPRCGVVFAKLRTAGPRPRLQSEIVAPPPAGGSRLWLILPAVGIVAVVLFALLRLRIPDPQPNPPPFPARAAAPGFPKAATLPSAPPGGAPATTRP